MTERQPVSNDPSWHDNLIYGFHLGAADADSGSWRSDLVFDIDHIVEWVCGTRSRPMFRVVPATLAFHDVTNLRMSFDFSGSGFHQAITELSIGTISKEPITLQSAVGPAEYYYWSFALNIPQGGEIVFGASGYTQSFRTEPLLVDEPRLPARVRPHLLL